MATIVISGRQIVIDDADIPLVSQVRWTIDSEETLRKFGNKPYARNLRIGYLHKWLVGGPKEMQVDHKNGDTLDNRRSNLRIATRGQNCWNTRVRRRGASPFKGVTRTRHRRPWRAIIRHNRRPIYLGSFATALEAAFAYDAAAVRLFGEYAAPNFPERFIKSEVA